jgi:hypothetical protein
MRPNTTRWVFMPRCSYVDSREGVEMVSLVEGIAGKPAHPPLTDVGIGAYTAGVAGGALTFVYGVRVRKRPGAPMADALIPGRADHRD